MSQDENENGSVANEYQRQCKTYPYATVIVLVFLCCVLFFIALRSWWLLVDSESKLDKLGAIKILDPSRLHVRPFPLSLNNREWSYRVYVPANQAYDVFLDYGEINPRQLTSSELESFKGMRLNPFKLKSHSEGREVVIQARTYRTHERSESSSKWGVELRSIDPVFPKSGKVTIMIPPAYDDFFDSYPASTSIEFIQEKETRVFPKDAVDLVLAWGLAYVYPKDDDGNTNFGNLTLDQWLREKKDKQEPGAGFAFWIRRNTE